MGQSIKSVVYWSRQHLAGCAAVKSRYKRERLRIERMVIMWVSDQFQPDWILRQMTRKQRK